MQLLESMGFDLFCVIILDYLFSIMEGSKCIYCLSSIDANKNLIGFVDYRIYIFNF